MNIATGSPKDKTPEKDQAFSATIQELSSAAQRFSDAATTLLLLMQSIKDRGSEK